MKNLWQGYSYPSNRKNLTATKTLFNFNGDLNTLPFYTILIGFLFCMFLGGCSGSSESSSSGSDNSSTEEEKTQSKKCKVENGVAELKDGECKEDEDEDEKVSKYQPGSQIRTVLGKGNLSFTRIQNDDLLSNSGTLADYNHAGVVYKGVYNATDGFKTEVYISLRNSAPVARLGLEIQGGTGTPAYHILNGDSGKHQVWVSIGQRGASKEDTSKEKECFPGENFLTCLKNHDTFSKTDPQKNASDVAFILEILTQDSFQVDGASKTAQTFFPQGLKKDAYNLLTSSFGGVIFGYLLEEPNAPPLHNVFLDQVTGPSENISDAPKLADRMLGHLFTACEDDSDCNSQFSNIRANFKSFMNSYKDSPFTLNGESDTYASLIFDHIMHIIERENKVGKAIKYIGEIANQQASGTITTTVNPDNNFESGGNTNVPSQDYGLPSFTGSETEWTDLLKRFGYDFFPGITSRTAMICSFAFFRNQGADSLTKLNNILANNQYAPYPYGFLMSYRKFLNLCPQLSSLFLKLSVPTVNDVDANKVLVFFGGLDVKHTLGDAMEMISYFKTGKATLIQQKYLGQGGGQDKDCSPDLIDKFWEAPDTDIPCEDTNNYTASQLDGW